MENIEEMFEKNWRSLNHINSHSKKNKLQWNLPKADTCGKKNFCPL